MERKKHDKANLENKRPVLLQIGFVVALVLSLGILEWGISKKKVRNLNYVPIDVEVELLPMVRPAKPSLAPPEPKQKQATRILVVDDDTPFDFLDEPNVPSPELDAGQYTSTLLMEPDEEGVDPEPEYYFAPSMPQFPGGRQALLAYLAKQTRYPPSALAHDIQGRVYVRFLVKANGQIANATVVRGVHPSLDSEALRVVATFPPWEPGRQGNQAVDVWFSLPVNFILI